MRDYELRLQLGDARTAIVDWAQRKLDWLTSYVDAQSHRADIVQTLPSSAPAGYLLLTPGDPNLYVGTGTGNPLRRIPTQPLP